MSDNNLPYDDELIFAKEEKENESLKKDFWKVMIVDDEEEVHRVTHLVLNFFLFKGKRIQFVSAYSAKQAKELIKEHPDTAIILLDVVMEEDDSGLMLVKYIRDDLKNNFVRIILRTGQPGQAPEEKVIIEYDINDYKAKTELTSQKLFTTIISALRSYQDIMTIEKNKIGLEKIIDASANIFKVQSMKKFTVGVLTQLTSILCLDSDAMYFHSSGFAAAGNGDEFIILAGSGTYQDFIHKNIKDVVSKDMYKKIEEVVKNKASYFGSNIYVIYFMSENNSQNIVYLEGYRELNDWEKNLINIFVMNVSIAYDNLYLNEEMENSQKEIIFTLGEIIENRSHETSNHVKRVSEYAKFLALKLGFSDEESEVLRVASALHDIGKIAIPDMILNKPGSLDNQEFEIMKKHCQIGNHLLEFSTRNIFRASTVIALQHHEKYNGKGYPCGIKGKEIHIYSRITAIADVFDALSHNRVYREAWNIDKVIDFFKNESGKHFDPEIVDIFLSNIEEIIKINEKFSN
ncbi:MAG: hypothetical protein A2Y34_17335 [Spirochaetes bacterium GWC1_27_15]|nr:MAG: hypothetical protein A2Z98_10380 [Spirochaetes bacterium GWB1_27_13]OHD20653.1 MAG: hypothetical protein A2Y34_17335 [Spirochaetes bacterium GWC1_27_15]